MLRAVSSPYSPSISTPFLFSLLPTLTLSSSTSQALTPLISPFNFADQHLHHKPLFKAIINSHRHFHFSRFEGISNSLMPNPHHSRPKSIRASFSAESSADSRTSSGGGREILVQHLLVKEEDHKLLVDLQKRIFAGEDLSDLATEHSICPSKEEGGMLGWVRKGQMVSEFEEAAFNAPLNRIVSCKTKFGWHLLQVLSEREESVLQHVQPAELHVKMQDPIFLEEAQLIDVREPEEVAKASLPGFQVLPLRQFGNWGPEIAKMFDPQKDTYVLCHHGMRSLQVAKWLQMQGFMRVFNISGGIHEYAVKVDPSVPTY